MPGRRHRLFLQGTYLRGLWNFRGDIRDLMIASNVVRKGFKRLIVKSLQVGVSRFCFLALCHYSQQAAPNLRI